MASTSTLLLLTLAAAGSSFAKGDALSALFGAAAAGEAIAAVDPLLSGAAGAVALVNGGVHVHHERDIMGEVKALAAGHAVTAVNPLAEAAAGAVAVAHGGLDVHKRSACPSGQSSVCNFLGLDCQCVALDANLCAFIDASTDLALFGVTVAANLEVCLCASVALTLGGSLVGTPVTVPTCDNGTPICSRTPSCSCTAPYVPSADGQSCVMPASPKARRSLSLGASKKEKRSCPLPEEEACPFTISRFSAYECIDTSSTLESCGGCVSQGKGVDCTRIEGARGVGCLQGQCVILSCEEGWHRSLDGGCRPDSFSAAPALADLVIEA